MAGDLVLTVDCGTQSLRTLIFDAEGALLAKKKMEYAPYSSPRPGWAEQDPEILWSALTEGCRGLKSDCPDLFARIGGIGVTAQRDTMINLDADGRVLRPAITWLDSRKARGSYRPNLLVRSAFRLIGKDKAVRKSMRDGKCNWIQENEPGIWEKTWKYVLVSGFLNYRLTGVVATDYSYASGSGVYDLKGWCYSDRLIAASGLSAELFPEIVPSTEVLGTLTSEAAAELGIDIPRLCYHPKLSLAGSCRVCVVEATEMSRRGPRRKLVPSCVQRVTDGMTLSEVVPLSETERVDEIARMVSGDTITKEARAAAGALLTG